MKKKNFLKEIKHQFLKKYETAVILNPDMEELKFNQFLDKVKDIMSKNNAEFLDFHDWGTRRLSYGIKNFNRGKFAIIHFSANGPFIQELERNLKIMEDCMRFQTVVYTKNLQAVKEEVING
ncbi:MAG: 30S ribosomal protein S6 [Deltaproteobacteria bacterium]|nr:30S ribosomal protein S6 [Deltaproteobacteria bacterium]